MIFGKGRLSPGRIHKVASRNLLRVHTQSLETNLEVPTNNVLTVFVEIGLPEMVIVALDPVAVMITLERKVMAKAMVTAMAMAKATDKARRRSLTMVATMGIFIRSNFRRFLSLFLRPFAPK